MKIQSLRAEELTLILTKLHELMMRKGPSFRDSAIGVFLMQIQKSRKSSLQKSNCLRWRDKGN